MVSSQLWEVELLISCGIVLVLIQAGLVGRDLHLLNAVLHDFAAEVKVDVTSVSNFDLLIEAFVFH